MLTDAVRRQIDRFVRAPDGEAALSRQAAVGTWAAMVGAVVLSRMVADPALADELLDGTRAWLVATGPRPRQPDSSSQAAG